jgi:hypothetical protein
MHNKSQILIFPKGKQSEAHLFSWDVAECRPSWGHVQATSKHICFKVQTVCSLDNKTKAPAAMEGGRVSNNFCRQSFIPKDPVHHGNEWNCILPCRDGLELRLTLTKHLAVSECESDTGSNNFFPQLLLYEKLAAKNWEIEKLCSSRS